MKQMAILAVGFFTTVCYGMAGNPNVRFSPTQGAFTLFSTWSHAQFSTDATEWPGVIRAARDLEADCKAVAAPRTGNADGHPPIVLIGTLGKSPTIDALVADRKIDVHEIAGKWEASVTQVVNLPGRGKCLVIAGSDKRGTIYAIYNISESIGVSPWTWWADVPVKHHSSAYVVGRYVSKSPVVKYRGIFLNDEAPSLSNWVYANYGEYRHGFYERIFQLLLRLHANYLWPAMWNNSFSVDDPLNPQLADEYGIVMGTSHVEPMMRADKEWNRLHFPDRQWNYATNPKLLEAFWRDGVVRNMPYENIVTIAMRGKVDTPMSESANISLLEQIVAAQRRILADNVNPDVTQIPQLWCLYKEVQEYYEKGMRVPDDVTLLWADDNWGDIRRLPTPEERKRTGGAGVYYHFDYVGGPRNYKWIDTNPIPKIWEQMNLAHHYGADRIWIVNVGDMKPKAFPIEFFLTMALDPAAIKKEDLQKYTEAWVAREFGSKYAVPIARIVSETARLNGRRKPELVGPDTYSILNYNEADRVAKEFHDLFNEATEIGKRLLTEYQSAYYELVVHSIKAPMVLHDLYVAAAKNALYAKQGRVTANVEAERVKQLFAEDADVTAEYHKLNGGKWNHFMDQTHIGYTSWQQPDRNICPRTVKVDIPDRVDVGIAIEGSDQVWPESQRPAFLQFTRYGQREAKLEVFTRGAKDALYNVSSDQSWIRIRNASGQLSLMNPQREAFVSIDWNRIPGKRADGEVRVGDTTIRVIAWNWQAPTKAPSSEDDRSGAVVGASSVENSERGTFLEGDGVIAIEAHHPSRRVATRGVKWETIPGHGRIDSAIEPFPVEFKSFEPGVGPRVEYEVWTYPMSAPSVTVDAVVAPSLAFQPSHGLRFAIAFDNDKPQVVDAAPVYLSRDWEKSVSDSVRHVLTKHTLKPGKHILKVWAVDPGVVIGRLVIDDSGLKPSYLGPPESIRMENVR